MIRNLLLLAILTIPLYSTVYSQSFEDEIISAYEKYKYENVFEYAFIRTNNSTYFSGGTIDFSLIIFDQYFQPSSLSKIAYLELIHEKDKYHEKYVFRLDSGTINAHINLPSDISSGNYELVAYTQYMTNFELDSFAHRIPLYIQNVFDEHQPQPVVVKKDYETDRVLNNSKKDDEWVVLSDDGKDWLIDINDKLTGKLKDTYLISEGFRSLQFIVRVNNNKSFTIAKDQFKGTIQRLVLISNNKEVIAVKNFCLLNDEIINDSESTESKIFEFQDLSCLYQTSKENNLELFPGSLFNRLASIYYRCSKNFYATLDKPFINFSDAGSEEHWRNILEEVQFGELNSYPEANQVINGRLTGANKIPDNLMMSIHFFKNDIDIFLPVQQHDFSVSLVAPSGQDYLFFSLYDENGNDMTDEFEVLLEPEFNVEFSASKYKPGKHSDTLIQEAIEFNYILATFNQEPYDSYFWNKSEFDDSYLVTDYNDLNSLKEFIAEAIPRAVVRKSNDLDRIYVYNSEDGKLFKKAPLVILNDEILKDESTLFELSLSEIQSISIIHKLSTLKRFGTPFINGVVAIETKEPVLIQNSRHPNFQNISTYTTEKRDNRLSKIFNSKILLEAKKGGRVEILTPDTSKVSPSYQIEMLSNEGIFYQKSGMLRCNER